MTQPVNGRHLLAKSLEVNRIEQIKAHSGEHQQQELGVKERQKQQERQKQVNESNQSEGEKISSEDKSGRKKGQKKQRNNEKDGEKDNKKEKKSLDDKRGNIIDIKV